MQWQVCVLCELVVTHSLQRGAELALRGGERRRERFEGARLRLDEGAQVLALPPRNLRDAQVLDALACSTRSAHATVRRVHSTCGGKRGHCVSP